MSGKRLDCRGRKWAGPALRGEGSPGRDMRLGDSLRIWSNGGFQPLKCLGGAVVWG